jgi:hypothetical protein
VPEAPAPPTSVPAAAADLDPGLVAFANLIGSKRFFCTQCGKCCTGDGKVSRGQLLFV